MISFNFIHVKKPRGFNNIQTWIKKVADDLFPNHKDITYIFCSDEDILELNKQALSHDYYTDIITFDLRDTLIEPLTCEIHISLDRVMENASSFNCTFAEELKRVMVHGLLHLSGMNDTTDVEKLAMRSAEETYIYKY